MSTRDFSTFTSIATVVLSVMVGILFTIPIAFSQDSESSPLLIIVGALAGAAAGYRRRKSRAFFYLALFCTITLSTIVYIKMIP